MIWFFILLDPHRAFRHDLHRASGAKSTVPPWRSYMLVTMKVTCLTIITISHHTPRCKTKLDASTFYPFASFTLLLGLSKIGTVSYLRTSNHNIGSIISFYDPLKEALACIAVSTKVRCAIHPPSHIYTVQAVCRAWNQSRVRVCVRSVAGSYHPTIP